MQSTLPLLLDIGIKSLVILTLALGITVAMRRSPAAARHLVWNIAVVSVLALPALTYLLPGLAVLPAMGVGATSQTIDAPSASTTPAAPPSPPSPSTTPGVTSSSDGATSYSPAAAPRASDAPVIASDASPASASTSPEAAAAPPGEAAASLTATITERVLPWLPWIWLGGAAFALVPLLLGWISLWQLRRMSRPITDGSWHHLLAELKRELGLKRGVTLLKSPCRTVPMTWGLVADVLPGVNANVLIPEQASDWSADRRRAVLLHELAHVKRRDCLTQTLTQLACALYWFNPLVWLAGQRMLVERERACDDMVLLRDTKPSDYAEHLLEIATGPQAGYFAAHAGIAMARASKLDGRLVAILDQHRNRRAMSRVSVALTIALLGAVVVPVAMLQGEARPEVVAGEVAQADAIKAQLDDITVELVGLAPFDDPQRPVKDLPWWRPEGSALDVPPYDFAAGLVLAPGSEDVDRFYVALRVPGHDVRELGFIAITAMGDTLVPRGYAGRFEPEVDRLANLGDIQAFGLAAPSNTDETSFRLGVAAGPWRTGDAFELGNRFPEPRDLGDTGETYILSAPRTTPPIRVRDPAPIIDSSDGTTSFDIAFTGRGHQLRVVCVDREGQLHEPAPGIHSTSLGRINNTRVTFLGLPPDSTDEVIVQFRPYRWVEFRNVSLKTGHETQVEVVQDSEIPAGEVEAEAAARSTVYIFGAIERPGAYNVPEGGELTVRQLVASVGARAADDSEQVFVDLYRPHDEGSMQRLAYEELFAEDHDPVVLIHGDILYVHRRGDAEPFPPPQGESDHPIFRAFGNISESTGIDLDTGWRRDNMRDLPERVDVLWMRERGELGMFAGPSARMIALPEAANLDEAVAQAVKRVDELENSPLRAVWNRRPDVPGQQQLHGEQARFAAVRTSEQRVAVVDQQRIGEGRVYWSLGRIEVGPDGAGRFVTPVRVGLERHPAEQHARAEWFDAIAATFTSIWVALDPLIEAIEAEDTQAALRLLEPMATQARRLEAQVEDTPLAPMATVGLAHAQGLRAALEQGDHEQAGRLAHMLREFANRAGQMFDRMRDDGTEAAGAAP